MATQKGQAKLAGRFPPGTKVALIEVRDERALRSEGGRTVERKKVGDDGTVTFSKGVTVGGRYFLVGVVNGQPLEVRITGRAQADDGAVVAQAPVTTDRGRLGDGSFVDEPPEQHQDPGPLAVGPALGQHQVPKGTVQRSDTPRGTAHPVDVDDQEPVRRQEDVNGPVQMSDTETGEASEILVGPQRQEDVPSSVVQRSSTATGVATPIPSGAVEAQRLAESSQARESRGDRTRAAADPLEAKGAKVGAVTGSTKKASEQRDADLKRSEREAAALVVTDQPGDGSSEGYDAQGQPGAADVAAAAGVESKDEARSRAAKKAAATRKRNERKAEKVRAEKARLEKPQKDPGSGSAKSKPSGSGSTTANKE